MRGYAPWNSIEEDFWKDLFIQSLPRDIGLHLINDRLNYTIDQIAHMADILTVRKCPLPDYRPFLTDRNSGVNFLIDSGSKCSMIHPTSFERNNLPPITRVAYLKGKTFAVYGMKNLTVDLGFNTHLQWNFIVADIVQSVIGADFLVHFNLTLDVKSKRLIRLGSSPTLYDAANVIVEDREMRAEIYKKIYLEPDHCLFLTDKISGLKFVIDSGASCSQIPRMPKERLTPLPYTRFVSATGSPINEFGYKYLTVDLGLRTKFSWKFVISDFGPALIGIDFLKHFCLSIDLRRRRLIIN